jgi:hypothetical protein
MKFTFELVQYTENIKKNDLIEDLHQLYILERLNVPIFQHYHMVLGKGVGQDMYGVYVLCIRFRTKEQKNEIDKVKERT